MEHAKKMILVEPRVLESISRPQPVEDATNRDLKETSRAMDDVLNSNGDVNDKADAYQQALWGFLQRYKQYKKRPLGKVELTSKMNKKKKKNEQGEEEEEEEEAGGEVEEEEEDVVETETIQTIPIGLKKKAERLLIRLKVNPEIKWNDRGEISINGRYIRRSNLIDLVNDVLRARKTAPDPTGWEEFADVLRNSNVPQDLIGNPTRWNYIQGATPVRKRFDEEEGYATPRGGAAATPVRGKRDKHPWSTKLK